MIVTLRTPIGDIVAKQPRAGAVFEQHQINYCCEGDQPLQVACAYAKADPALVLQQIHQVASEALVERDWTGASLRELSEHIVTAHHAFLRRGVNAFASWLDESATGARALAAMDGAELAARLTWFRQGLEPHLRHEEQRIFPAIVRVERAHLERRPVPRSSPAILRPEVPLLAREHRAIDEGLRQLRRAASRILAAPAGPNTVLDDLAALEADVHRHLHLENNILFPRATALEEAYA